MSIRRKLFNKKYCIYGHRKTKTNTSSYMGMTGNNLKTWYYNHLKSFKNKRYKDETELSKYIWKLKEKEVEHTITWKKLRNSNTCQRHSGLCNLCLMEKIEILLSKAKPSTQLNSRFEVSTCRHVSPPTSIAPTSKPIPSALCTCQKIIVVCEAQCHNMQKQ